jgi:hypothetical protein
MRGRGPPACLGSPTQILVALVTHSLPAQTLGSGRIHLPWRNKPAAQSKAEHGSLAVFQKEVIHMGLGWAQGQAAPAGR